MIREGLSGEVSSACNLGSEKDRKEHSRHRGEQGQRPRAGSMTGSAERGPGGPGGRRAGPGLPKILPNGSKRAGPSPSSPTPPPRQHPPHPRRAVTFLMPHPSPNQGQKCGARPASHQPFRWLTPKSRGDSHTKLQVRHKFRFPLTPHLQWGRNRVAAKL